MRSGRFPVDTFQTKKSACIYLYPFSNFSVQKFCGRMDGHTDGHWLSNFGHRGWNLRSNRDRYRYVYIYILDQEEKWKPFRKYFFVWKVYTGNRICQNFDLNARRLTKIEPNEIFNDFAISRELYIAISRIDEIDSNFFNFKGMD